MSTPVYVFDIDGTLANGDHRLPLIQVPPGEKKNWDAYFALCGKDEPIPHMIQLCQILSQHGIIKFVSGRRYECLRDTLLWLKKHVGEWVGLEQIFLRKPDDHRDDNIIKMEILNELRTRGFEPTMAFDDRTRVVDAWRKAGIPCLQIAPGDF